MFLLIVDDDYQIREGMRYGIDWKELGITDVETCANGLEAMDLVQKKMPDLIVVDIQMPGMNGLELVSEIRKINSAIRIIFISAYSEFEYCRQALLLGANDYVLKPIRMSEFMEVIRKNISEFNREKERKGQYIRALLEQKARNIYEGRTTDDIEAMYAILEEEFDVGGDYYLTILMQIGQESAENPAPQEAVMKLGSFMNRKMVILTEVNGHLAGISAGNNSALTSIYLQNLLKLQLAEWNRIYGSKYGFLTAGISNSCDKNGTLKGYEQALQALEETFYGDRGALRFL